MNEITEFKNYEFGTLRQIDIDNEPWFVGKDVASALGYTNTRKAISDHVDGEDRLEGVTIRYPLGGEQKPILINESGLYSLILSSKLDSAKRFKRWITSEVLPQIGRIFRADESSNAHKRLSLLDKSACRQRRF